MMSDQEPCRILFAAKAPPSTVRYEIREGTSLFLIGLEQDCTPVSSKFKLNLGALKPQKIKFGFLSGIERTDMP